MIGYILGASVLFYFFLKKPYLLKQLLGEGVVRLTLIFGISKVKFTKRMFYNLDAFVLQPPIYYVFVPTTEHGEEL